MRKETSLPVRLEPDTKNRLQKAAQAMGITPSTLIRILVCSFVDEFERGGGRITFPLQWKCQPLVAETRANYGGRDRLRGGRPLPERAVPRKTTRQS